MVTAIVPPFFSIRLVVRYCSARVFNPLAGLCWFAWAAKERLRALFAPGLPAVLSLLLNFQPGF